MDRLISQVGIKWTLNEFWIFWIFEFDPWDEKGGHFSENFRKRRTKVKFIIFKSKNPFENYFFGSTIGRTGPKKEDMSSKRMTSGNPGYQMLSNKVHIIGKLINFCINFCKNLPDIENVYRDIGIFLINPQFKYFDFVSIFHGFHGLK